MKMAFSLTQDPVVLEEFLAVSSRSISEFIDGNMRVITQIILQEKEAAALDEHIDKRSLVSRLLDGREVDSEQLGRRLNYNLVQKHQAFVVWSETPDAEIRLLEGMARGMAQLFAARLPGQWLQYHPDRRGAGHPSQYLAAQAGACPGLVACAVCRPPYPDWRSA